MTDLQKWGINQLKFNVMFLHQNLLIIPKGRLPATSVALFYSVMKIVSLLCECIENGNVLHFLEMYNLVTFT